MRKSGSLLRGIAGALAVFSGSVAKAQTWTGSANKFWNNAANWTGGIPSSSSANIVFSNSAQTVSVADIPFSFNSLTFASGAPGFAIGGNGFTVGGGGITNTSSTLQTVENPIALSAAQIWSANGGGLLFHGDINLGSRTLTVGGGQGTTIGGVVSGTGSLVKTGSGTLVLDRDGQLTGNTYGGGTFFNQGVVSVSENRALGNSGGSLFFYGGTLEITGATFTSTSRGIVWGNFATNGIKIADAGHTFTVGQSLTGSGALTKTGPGTLVLSGANTYTGATTISEGTVRLAGGNAIRNDVVVSIANTSGATLDLNGTSETVGAINGGGASGGNIHLGAGTLTVSGGNFAGTISGAGGALAAVTSTLYLSGANTFNGGTTVSGMGSIWVQPGGTLGTAAITVSGGGSYDEISNSIFLIRSDAIGGATSTPTQTISVSNAGFITSQGSFTTLGAVTLNGGIIETDGGESAGQQAFFLRGTITVEASAATAFIREYSPGIPNGGVHLLGGASGGTAFDVANGSSTNDLIVSAKLIDPPADAAGNGRLVKSGAGNMKLESASTFTGETKVSGGTLEIGGEGAVTATSQITVNGGGTLLLSGDAATNKLNDAAAVDLHGGTLRLAGLNGLNEQVGALTLSSSSIIDFGLATTSESLRFSDSHSASWSGMLNVWNWSAGVDHLYFGSDSGGLTSTQLAQVNFFSDGGFTLVSSGAAFVSAGQVVPVPEASTVGIAAALMGLICWRERRGSRRLRALARCAIFFALTSVGWTHGDLDLAIAAANREIVAQPENAKLFLRRGGLHREHADVAAANADFDRALALDPQLFVADLLRGEMLCERGRPEEARMALDRFMQNSPRVAAGHAARARSFVAMKNWQSAAEDFAQSIALADKPEPTLFIERAAALRSGGNFPDAIRTLNEGMARLGPLITLAEPAIELEAEEGKLDAAIVRLTKVLESAPRKERWLFRRGELLEKSGKTEEAQKDYVSAQEALAKIPIARRETPAMKKLAQTIGLALHRTRTGP